VSNSVTTAESDASRNAVFAPGHLGELTWQVPVELVDAVLAETKTTQRRLRDLPSRVGVYFMLAWCLFPALGYRKVWAKLTATLRCRKPPSDKALRDLRRRLGAAPVKALFEVLAGPVAAPRTPGVRFGRYRTVAFDGCVSFKVADTDRNRSALGKLKASLGVTGYPVMRLMTVVETGTRALLGAVFGPPSTGEIDYARALLPLLRCWAATCWCWPTAVSTPKPSWLSWPAPARSSWSGCASPAGCRCWPASMTAPTCRASAR
jgi:hypothetical protein